MSQGGRGHRPQGYGPPGYQPDPAPGQGQGNQPTQAFNYQGASAA